MPDPVGDISFIWPYFAVFIAAYLIGSIPFGLIVTRFAGLGDIRKIGSGNIGATNVLRTGRRSLAALTLILDASKGAIPVVLADHFLFRDQAIMAGAGALLGHMLPIWLIASSKHGIGFALRESILLVVGAGVTLLGKELISVAGAALLASSTIFAWGGKGVATGLGVLLAINPPIGVLACATWLILALVFRYSSLAAVGAFVTAPVYAVILSNVPLDGAYWSDPQRVEFSIFVAVVILIRHGDNIGRLLTGVEPKIGKRTGGPDAARGE
ncbi:MAG: glycerol-3-phosphate acyltransferase [Proteobacteria bacterium]|nr:glycerol-3-phosphate acyltransferase [Pseudomonadota bacterium]MDA1059008.1 glycerol-3-phosphate acyltransferase [Pseudomonadota bacterium]